jgi:hypothetical protein
MATSTPEKSAILSLAPNVSEQQALRVLRGRGLSAFPCRAFYGPLRRIATAYVPFSLYRVELQDGRERQTRFMAIDQVEGILDLYEFPDALKPGELVKVVTPNTLAATLPEASSCSLLRVKLLRLIFQKGFFRVRKPRLQLERLETQFNVPFWIGLYGEDGSLRCRVLDAVRRRMEGDKAVALFEQWLAA